MKIPSSINVCVDQASDEPSAGNDLARFFEAQPSNPNHSHGKRTLNIPGFGEEFDEMASMMSAMNVTGAPSKSPTIGCPTTISNKFTHISVSPNIIGRM